MSISPLESPPQPGIIESTNPQALLPYIREALRKPVTFRMFYYADYAVDEDGSVIPEVGLHMPVLTKYGSMDLSIASPEIIADYVDETVLSLAKIRQLMLGLFTMTHTDPSQLEPWEVTLQPPLDNPGGESS